MGRLAWGLVLLALMSAPPARAAEPLPKPAGAEILRITGEIRVRNRGDAAVFDRAMLDALPQTTVATHTPWTEGRDTYTGVTLSVLLERVGAHGTMIDAAALNDYVVTIPISDARLGVLIASRRNGEPMPVRDKGPLWIIYPLDSNPSLDGKETRARMIWQLKSLNVR